MGILGGFQVKYQESTLESMVELTKIASSRSILSSLHNKLCKSDQKKLSDTRLIRITCSLRSKFRPMYSETTKE
jgi:hypothetical protein